VIVEQQQDLGRVLLALAEELDISPAQYEEAVRRYEAVGDWLAAEDSTLAVYDPEVCPQGSFRLGTVTKPVDAQDEYDIDLVCQLAIAKDDITKEELKRMVGDRLKEHGVYSRMLDDEKRRCWTLSYEDRKFHIDILPAIPEEGGPPNSILITDKKLRNWLHSNPKNFAEWFRSRMAAMFDRRRRCIAEALRASVEDVPEWQVKTPLQRAVQLLKRHRDIRFNGDKDDKPASIIITTLAAHAYDDEEDLLHLFLDLPRRMRDHVKRINGFYSIPNPADPREDFADRWREHPQRAKKFFAWLETMENDLKSALAQPSPKKLLKRLTDAFGGASLRAVFRRLGLPADTVPARATPEHMSKLRDAFDRKNVGLAATGQSVVVASEAKVAPVITKPWATTH